MLDVTRETVSLETGAIVVLSGEYAATVTGAIPVLSPDVPEVVPLPFVGSGTVEGETVFLSHGEHAPLVEGAWVLVEPFDSWG